MHNIRFVQTCLITLLLLIAACTQQHQDGSQTVRVNVDEDLPADSFISQYSFIQLDSVTSPMVSQVRDIRLLDSLIFILDDAGRIFTFSSEGRHLATLDSLGMGSGQYATADAFDITKAGIYVLSRPQKRIMQYSFDGHLTRICPVHDYYLGFRVQADSMVVLASGNCNNRKANFITMEMSTQKFKHEAEHFDRTESYTSDTYHPFVGQQGDTLLITNPFRTDIKMLAHGQSTPLCTFRFNTEEQMPANQEEYTFEELAQMTKHKPVVHNIALACATCDARYIGYEMFGEYGLSYLLTRIKADGSTQNMTIMNNPEPNFPYLSAPVCASDGQLVSVMPAYMLLQTEKAYGLNQFTSAGLKPTDNPVIFLHRLR
ncbi:MAG: 6-bladed beta-propeller [Prevotellaceae bacterium]|nr:6-bladed beta-propeller [Prevotellaceae bacterium]